MILDPQTLRHNPQLAAIELLLHAAETAIIAVCAAHPNIEHDLRNDPELPIDKLAEDLVDQASHMLDALGYYRQLLHQLHQLNTGRLPEDDLIF